jgi:His-Xaa-Ser system radical SAM maturase HxsC
MIHLRARPNPPAGALTLSAPLIARITTNPDLPRALRPNHILKWEGALEAAPAGFGLILVRSDLPGIPEYPNMVRLAPQLSYLTDGDVIKYHPQDHSISVLFRHNANTHSFLVTERCNSFCVMCSQPPRDVDDRYLVEDMLAALPLLPEDTREIGITGGEPTLLGQDFIRLLWAAKTHLPRTALHVLSNGRNFKDLDLAVQVAKVKHPDLMIGIPLYADYSQLHDYIVQADNAFDDTLRGILNLKRCQQKVELRVVIHRANYRRLPRLAEFIARNLIFLDHVALMALEMVGFAKSNRQALWIDPYNYRYELAEAVDTLARYRMHVSLYNHPLCVIPASTRRFAVKSISDWKNDYLDVCASCQVKEQCGGFFSWNLSNASAHIQPFQGPSC